MSDEKVEELSYGKKAVGMTFNPSSLPAVDDCKLAFSRIIDELHKLREESVNAEVKRMCSVAITEAQTSQMWAVKALTWQY